MDELLKNTIDVHRDALADWYVTQPQRVVEVGECLSDLVAAQHFCNFRLWNLEDQARRTDVPDSRIAEIKRAIDGWNQHRNDLIERIDEHVLEMLGDHRSPEAVQHSETVGMIIDRLSILSLKCHHMALNVSRSNDRLFGEECAAKLATLDHQRAELGECLLRLVSDVRAGTRFFNVYRQHKAYNDPRLNPALSPKS